MQKQWLRMETRGDVLNTEVKNTKKQFNVDDICVACANCNTAVSNRHRLTVVRDSAEASE